LFEVDEAKIWRIEAVEQRFSAGSGYNPTNQGCESVKVIYDYSSILKWMGIWKESDSFNYPEYNAQKTRHFWYCIIWKYRYNDSPGTGTRQCLYWNRKNSTRRRYLLHSRTGAFFIKQRFRLGYLQDVCKL